MQDDSVVDAANDAGSDGNGSVGGPGSNSNSGSSGGAINLSANSRPSSAPTTNGGERAGSVGQGMDFDVMDEQVSKYDLFNSKTYFTYFLR